MKLSLAYMLELVLGCLSKRNHDILRFALRKRPVRTGCRTLRRSPESFGPQGGESFGQSDIWNLCHPERNEWSHPVKHTHTYFCQQVLCRYEEALRDYNRSLELRPDDLDVLRNRACVFSLTERLDAAL